MAGLPSNACSVTAQGTVIKELIKSDVMLLLLRSLNIGDLGTKQNRISLSSLHNTDYANLGYGHAAPGAGLCPGIVER